MSAAMVDRNADYPSADYGRPMYDSRPQNDYGHPSYDYNRPTYDSYQQPGDYNRSSYDPPRAQERYDQPSQYQRAPDPQVQKPVYYTTGGSEQGLPIGNYGQTRKVLNDERHRDYNKFMKEKEEQASRHRDEMLQQRQVSPPRQPQAEMYDHNQVSQTLREERKKEYNDYLKEVNGTPRAPPTPPVGLNIPTEAERHRIAELKKKQYREELLRQQKEQILNRAQHQLEIPVIDRRQANSDPPPPLDLSQAQDRPPSGRWDPDSYRQSNLGAVKRVTSPPHQANIGHDDYGSYRRQTEHEVRNKEYNEFLAKKQHMEDEKRMKLVEQRRQAPAPIVKGDYYSSEQYDHKRQALRDQQHREYQNYLKRHDQPGKRAPTPDYLQGLPLSQRQYDNMRKMQEKQRNQEYNQLLAKKGFDRHQPPETNRRPEIGMRSEFQDQFQDPLANRGTRSSEMEQYMSRVDNQAQFNLNSHIQEPAGRQSQKNVPVGSLITGDRVDYPSSANVKFNNERRREYNEYIKKQEADRYRRQDNNRSENRIGFMSQLGKPVEEIRERLAKERHEDYNKYLQTKYNAQSPQRPLERPKWVDPKIMEDNWQKEAGGSRSNSRPPSNKPVQTPTYEEMLQRKRREEASYRRYDDPEYSRSGDPGRRPMP